jgi:hypothetical protein
MMFGPGTLCHTLSDLLGDSLGKKFFDHERFLERVCIVDD